MALARRRTGKTSLNRAQPRRRRRCRAAPSLLALLREVAGQRGGCLCTSGLCFAHSCALNECIFVLSSFRFEL